MGASPGNAQSDQMRKRIKRTATSLLIKNGFRGTSYGDIAAKLGITTTNIHYHCGPKKRVVEVVVHDYGEATLARHREIWLHPVRPVPEKPRGVGEFSSERHGRLKR